MGYTQTESGILLPNYEIYVKPTELQISQRKMENYLKLAEIKQWGIQNPTKFLKEFVGVELLDAQEYAFMNSWFKPYALWLESRAAGKMLALDTRIPTPNGDTTIGELKVGDTIFDDKGNHTKVIYLSPVEIPKKTYLVEFEDGEKIHACSEHLWNVIPWGHKEVTRTTEELAQDYFTIRKQAQKNDGYNRKEYSTSYKYRVRICEALKYEEKQLQIPPYVLGLWLGDGAVYDGTLTSHINDYEEIIKHIENTGCTIHSVRNDRETKKRINIHNTDGQPLLTVLRNLNLLNEKHIPENYLHGSVEQRYELLRGLMDSDGCVDLNGRCEFTQSSKKHNKLLKDISILLDSLGIKHNISYSKKKCQTGVFDAGRIYFIVDKNHSCFKLERKYSRLRKNIPTYSTKKSIVSITEEKSVAMRCIQVDSPSHLYLCGDRNTITHNTTMLALYSMLKGLLFNNYRIYICSGTADQSQETFKKIEDIALKNIESMTGLTDVFKSEVEVSQANSNGFIHNPMGFTYKLYNGSFVKTLNSNINAKRGKRAESVIFDEGGWLSEEEFNVIGAFTALNSDFQLGGDVDVSALPKKFPNQLLYASSASSVDTAFYNKYKDFSKKMFLGDPRYFVADINCDIVINATFHGKLYPASLLNRETVENELRNNPEKAQREYYNQFTQDGGIGQIIKRALIVRNSYTRPPVLSNDTGKRKFVLAYDPARSTDNSVLGIGELKYNDDDGYTMDIVNVISFADLGLRRKTPMMTHEQIKEIHNILLDYNGSNIDYENIEMVLADAGSGGGGNSWVRDNLILDWKDKSGKTHPGLIDKDYPNGDVYAKRYPNAVQKLKLIEPSKYKSEMYEALIKMVEANKITFTEKYDNKGYLNIMEVNEKLMKESEASIRAELDKLDLDIDEYEEMLEERLSMIEAAKTTVYNLSLDEEVALTQIDVMKEQIVHICRVKRDGGKDAFRLPAHKDSDIGVSESTMHDDHAYVLAMLGWYLSEKRMEHIRNAPKRNQLSVEEKMKLFQMRAPKKVSRF